MDPGLTGIFFPDPWKRLTGGNMGFIDEDMKLKVKHGAHWMDEKFPGWATRINLDNLEMDDCDTCIIGQASMDLGYWNTVESGSNSRRMKDNVEWAISHGFDIQKDGIINWWHDEEGSDLSEQVQERYYQLEVLWTDEVRKRLG